MNTLSFRRPKRTIVPASIARINWANPLTRGLVFCTYPGMAPIDLVGGTHGNLYNGATIQDRRLGRALATTDRDNDTMAFAFPGRLLSIGTSFSVASLTEPEWLNTHGKLVSIPYRTTNTWNDPWVALAFGRSGSTSSGGIAWASSGTVENDVISATGFIQDADDYVLYGVSRATSTVRFYRNGVQYGSDVTTGTVDGATGQPITGSPDFTNRADVHLLQRSRYFTSIGEGTLGRNVFSAIWNRNLTAAEWASLQRNPYQLLQATPRVYKTSVHVVTATIARPSADITDGSWLKSSDNTNTNLYTMLDEEVADDNDYIYSKIVDATEDVCEIRLSVVADPGIDTGHRVTVRARKDVADGDIVHLHLSLYEGANIRATTTDGDVGWPKVLDATFTNYTWDIPSSEIANLTAYTDLRLRIHAVKG